jgi:UDP-2,3-diacylglucosamine hydrolase
LNSSAHPKEGLPAPAVSKMKKLGLIAGNRRFPIIFAQAAKKQGYYVAAIAIKGDTSSAIRSFADKVYWLKLSEFSRLFDIFKNEGIEDLVLAGQISPWRLFSKEVLKDEQLKNLLNGLEDKRADTIFIQIVKMLENQGFKLLDSTFLINDLMPQKGVLSKCQPEFSVWEDVYFGLDLAKAVSYLDIGQTVAVKTKAIVAVEALEGTDRLIRRAGRVAGQGVTVVKVSKPQQDMRFDVPVVGLNTVKNLVRARASCLAIEAGKTLFLDLEKSLRLANSKGLAVVAV